MKRLILSIVMAFGLMAGTSVLAAGSCPRGPMKGGGFFHPMRGMEQLLNRADLAESINLTDEQKTKITEVADRFEAESIALEANMKTAHLAMKRLMRAESTDREAIFKAMDDIDAAELNWKKAEMAAWLDARNVLTADQQTALRKKMCDMHRERKGKGKNASDRCGVKCAKGKTKGQCPMMKETSRETGTAEAGE